MSNNSGITPEGLEMGRAQIVQAEAARIVPHVDMNPILLKPTGETGSQVILLGNAIRNNTASEYFVKRNQLIKETHTALNRLQDRYPFIIIEGAGSCAEVNLMPNDIVNFNIAEYADAPVILVADIHRGGVFGQIVGTLACLPRKQRERIAGFIINRFRGDKNLFSGGIRWIEQKTKKRIFGVLPYDARIHVEAEDSVVIENPKPERYKRSGHIAVAVIRLPYISNFTDVDPLSRINGLDLLFIEKKQNLSLFHAVILPGSKNTRYDLNWLNAAGWTEHLLRYAKDGGRLLGICGGYQMLGRRVSDPDGVEGGPGSAIGLSLLPVETLLKSPKTTTLTQFRWGKERGSGYEIHMGRTRRFGGRRLFSILMRNGSPCRDEDGCCTSDFRIMGTYIHGLFDSPGITRRWLKTISADHLEVPEEAGFTARDREYESLADHFEKHVDMNAIENLLTT